MIVRGTILHCSRFGAVVRLEDGRLALYPSDGPGMAAVRRASSGGRRPQFPFDVDSASARRVRLSLAPSTSEVDDKPRQVDAPASSSLEQKIIDYLRQTAEWDPRASQAPTVRGDERPRADRLLPFELRARRQYRDSPERPRRRKR
ncbi:MAG TPA: hypothetical protein VEV38_02405 [Candidatus Eremiobacteraceae bacterium]|nr:hypothetical protein [Candidatus Eremiobacteraceae bacterium]